MLNRIHKLEKTFVDLLNLDGWDLKHTGESFDSWDAIGKTPKGKECVIEFKFRNKYYSTKVLEQKKCEKLLESGKEVFYIVNDEKANYWFWLNDIILPDPVERMFPNTTAWNGEKILKSCYLLEEKKAIMINKNY